MSGTRQETAWPLHEIFFYLTGECNLRCRHCWISPRFREAGEASRHLAPELFEAVIEQALSLGLRGVKLSGGEPLLHPEMFEILACIKNKGLRLTLETNGLLCTPELAEVLATHENVSVSVSLDGADAVTHEWVRGVGGCFAATLKGLDNLIQAGLKPQLIMTLLRRNVGQLEEVVHLAEGLGAGSVKFNLLQPTERGALMHGSSELLGAGEVVALGHKVEKELARSTRLPLMFHYPPAFRPLSRQFGRNGDGCAICGIKGILGLLHDGSYALCGIGESTPELVFGHAGRVRLAEVWTKHPVLQELRAGLPRRLEGICAECLMKSMCLGSCIAQNYYRCGSLWGPFWFCEQAHREGVFPETRLRPRTALDHLT